MKLVLKKIKKIISFFIHYQDAVVTENSKVGKYTVLFDNVKIINSIIGDYSFIQKNTIVLNSTIGKFCSIADNVHIGLGQHPLDKVSTHPAFYSISQPIPKTFATKDTYKPYKPISIGNDVWIGSNVIIMDNVIIGDGAVIAAGAVVTKNVDNYSIVGGVPARHIKHRFEKDIIKKLEIIKWWDKDESWLQKNSSYFDDPKSLINKNQIDVAEGEE